MKKLSFSLSILFIVFTVLPSSAQIRLGVIGGLNLANFDIDPSIEGAEFKNRSAFGFGGVFDYGLNGSISFHVEPMYLQKGSKAMLKAAGIEARDYEFKLAYIELPVMLKYSFGLENIKPYIMIGPTVSYLLSSKVTVTKGDDSIEEDRKDKTKNIDFGLGFGGGVSISMGNNSIFVEARYAPGLTNINDDPNDPDTEIKTKGIQIFAGITFPIGK